MFRLVSVLGNVRGHQVWMGHTCKAGERGGEGNAELISHLVSQMVTMTKCGYLETTSYHNNSVNFLVNEFNQSAFNDILVRAISYVI